MEVNSSHFFLFIYFGVCVCLSVCVALLLFCFCLCMKDFLGFLLKTPVSAQMLLAH